MIDPRSSAFVNDFGQCLLQLGLLDDAALLRAKSAQAKTNERFDLVLTRLGLISEQDLAVMLARHLGLATLEPASVPAFALLTDELRPQFLKANAMLPVAMDPSTLTIATPDPFNTDALRAVGYQVGRTVECVISTPSQVEDALEALYEDAASESPLHDREVDLGDGASQTDIDRLKDIASEAPIVLLVNQLLAKAIERGASDIHVEPLEDRACVRFRLDGVLQPVQDIPQSMKAAVTSRVKILARLNIAEQRLPQDGRIKHNARGRELDLRVSTTPTIWGESVVLRILDRGHIDLSFPALGFCGPLYSAYADLLKQPNGIILVTGPTGSGKTTTLYTSLDALNQPERKIFTVEDPVEYQLKGINQIQVKPNIGLTFAAALRSILRQDPDIIMIGEIRDLETAQIAVQSSLTGHLVFATLHTNSAAATVTRLLDMGVENYLLASSVIGVLAQRLVRKLCLRCAESREATYGSIEATTPLQLTQAAHALRETNGSNFRIARGCAECGHTGFRGRTTIMELLVMTDQFRQSIMSGGTEKDMEELAISAGMQTMYEDGMAKALAGETTIEEVLRVTRAN